MAKVIPLRQAAVGLITLIASAVLLYFGQQWPNALLHSSTPSSGSRWLAVAIAVISIVPWIYCIAWAIAAADEFVQHVALVGTALAFVVDLLVHIAFNVMMDARLLAPDSYLPEIGVAICCWIVTCAISILYYRPRA
jgi:hypothetical protein